MEIQRICIVGARGQMGALFSGAFLACGVTIAGLDLPMTPEKVEAAVSECDLLLLCVPVTAFRDVLAATVPHLKKGAILADVGSVKVRPMKQMLEAYTGPVVGTHPLFGPVIPDGFDARVAVVEGRSDEAADLVARLFECAGYETFPTSAEDHDKAMAYMQGMNFITTIAYLSSMRQVDGIENFVTPSFNRRLEAAQKMMNQDVELFETISEANPFMQESARQFMGFVSLAAGGDVDLLAERARWWWRNESDG